MAGIEGDIVSICISISSQEAILSPVTVTLHPNPGTAYNNLVC